jgi:hypothetical protein
VTRTEVVIVCEEPSHPGKAPVVGCAILHQGEPRLSGVRTDTLLVNRTRSLEQVG